MDLATRNAETLAKYSMLENQTIGRIINKPDAEDDKKGKKKFYACQKIFN